MDSKSVSKDATRQKLNISDSKLKTRKIANTSKKDKESSGSDNECYIISDDSPASSQGNEPSKLKKLLDKNNDIDDILDVIDHSLGRNCKCQKCTEEDLSSIDLNGPTVSDSCSTVSEYSSTETQDWKTSCQRAQIKEQKEIQAENEFDLYDFFHQQYENTYEAQNNIIIEDLCKIVDEATEKIRQAPLEKQQKQDSQKLKDSLFDFSVFDNMESEIMTRHATSEDELENIIQDALMMNEFY